MKKVFALIVLVLLAGCSNMGGLEVDTPEGDSIRWSMPDENCIQTGELILRNGIRIKRTQIAPDCVPGD